LADEALRKEMGAKGRQRAETHFSWRTIANQVLALYASLVSRKTQVSDVAGV
jgi:starch synthase